MAAVLVCVPGVGWGMSIQHNRPDSGIVQAGDPLFGGVGRLTGSTGLCTAAAISPMVILTAAHCLEGANYTFRYETSSGAASISLIGASLHPSYQRGQTGSFNAFGDIALGFLASPLPAEVEPYSLWLGTDIPVGAAIVLNGFGQEANGQAGRIGSAGTHRYGYNFIEGVAYGGTAFESRFDFQPGPPAGCKLCTDIPQGGRTVGRFEGVITPGDSGGPVLFSGALDFATRAPAGLSIPPGKGSVPVIIGINSYTYRPGYVYGTVTGFTFVGSYLDWILQSTLVSALSADLGGPIENVSFTSTGEVVGLPPAPDPESVPEPGTGWLFVAGVAAVMMARRGR